ncbi:MAG TPA: kelch repeat-containing protein, partial [Myxococcota bacterium]|nr:kelch repeat-containing protein [Myxococcota bacterium]
GDGIGADIWKASVEVFDASLGTFSEVGALGEARVAPAMVATPEGVLVIGGWTTFREWPVEQAEDRTASARIDRITFDGGPRVESLGSLLHARAEASAVLLPDQGEGARVFVCGGLPGPGDALDSCELVDPATGASAESSRVLPRYRHTATLLDDGRVLIAGGFNDDGPASAYNNAQILDPLGGRVTVRKDMVAKRAGHTAHLLRNGMVLLVGGQGANGQPAIEDYELFNP